MLCQAVCERSIRAVWIIRQILPMGGSRRLCPPRGVVLCRYKKRPRLSGGLCALSMRNWLAGRAMTMPSEFMGSGCAVDAANHSDPYLQSQRAGWPGRATSFCWVCPDYTVTFDNCKSNMSILFIFSFTPFLGGSRRRLPPRRGTSFGHEKTPISRGKNIFLFFFIFYS